MMLRYFACTIGAALMALASTAHAQTLEAIRTAHHLECGVVQANDDWNAEEVHGNLSALGTEICRAVGVAILGDAQAVDVHAFPAELEALSALRDGKIQLAVGLSPSATIATHFGVGFGPPVFYDTQRLLVAKQSGITKLADLRDKLICALDMSPPERVLHDEMAARNIPYALMTHSEQGEMDAAVAVRRCVAGAAMESRLAVSRANFHALVTDFVFLPERFGLAPVSPAYRYGDQAFGLVVDYTIYALIEAEALGITQQTIASAGERDDLRSDQLLGHDFATAQALGLAHDWAASVIAATGNYGEVFERTTGRPYHLERGLNALWTNGGLMRPLPMR